MVLLPHVLDHNTNLKHRAPGFVALFVGATGGIGFATLKVLTERLTAPRLYVVGRSEAKFASQLGILKQLNPTATVTFLEAEIALIKNVDVVCVELARLETQLDLLYMSPGSLAFGGPRYTAEHLDTCFALSYYSRMRLVQGLLPLLLRSSQPRVLSVLAGGHERTLFVREDDFGLRLDNGRNYTAIRAVDQLTTLHSLGFMHLARSYPEITFLHVHPGWVATDFLKNLLSTAGYTGYLLEKVIVGPLYRLTATSTDESGQRQAFHATSPRYPSRAMIGCARYDPNDMAMSHGLYTGFYRVLADGETSTSTDVLGPLEQDGWPEKVWSYTLSIFNEIVKKT